MKQKFATKQKFAMKQMKLKVAMKQKFAMKQMKLKCAMKQKKQMKVIVTKLKVYTSIAGLHGPTSNSQVMKALRLDPLCMGCPVATLAQRTVKMKQTREQNRRCCGK